jgi:hypothetical protein
MHKELGLDLMESKNNTSVYYRAIIRVKSPENIKENLLKQ